MSNKLAKLGIDGKGDGILDGERTRLSVLDMSRAEAQSRSFMAQGPNGGHVKVMIILKSREHRD